MDEFTYMTICCHVRQQQSDFPECQTVCPVQHFLVFCRLLHYKIKYYLHIIEHLALQHTANTLTELTEVSEPSTA